MLLPRQRAIALSCLVVIAGMALTTVAGPAFAATGPHDGSVDPATVNETATATHTFTVAIDNVSKDGNTDRFYVEFPDPVNGTLAPNYVSVINRTDRSGVSISSSKSIVDGPDNDSVRDTITFAVSPTGSGGVDVLVNVSTDVTWPNVTGDTNYTAAVAVTDSANPDVPLTTFATVTVEDLDGTGGSGTGGSGPSGNLSLASGSVDPATVNESTTRTHVASAAVDDLSADGSTDRLYVELPDAVGGDVTADSVTVVDRSDGSSVTVSDGATVVDGPDADSAADTVSVGIDPSGTGPVDVRANVSLSVTWPAVESDTSYPIEFAASDSAYGNVSATQFGSVTVQNTATSGDDTANATVALDGGSVVPATVNESATRTHRVTALVDNVSKDGSTDRFYVELPDAVAGSIAPNTVSVVNRTDRTGVSISSSKSLVDGPDGDGVVETLTFAVSPTGGGTVDVRVNVSADVTWPNVTSDTDYPVAVAASDSRTGNLSATQFATVTVEDLETTGGSAPPAVVGSAVPRDPDADGIYEDLNADGTVDLIDVAVLYNNRNDTAVTSNGRYYDVDGDGGFDLVDVSAFYDAVA